MKEAGQLAVLNPSTPHPRLRSNLWPRIQMKIEGNEKI